MNVQKYSFMQEDKRVLAEVVRLTKAGKLKAGDPRPPSIPYMKQWRWWIGMCMVILGAIGDFACYVRISLLSLPPPSFPSSLCPSVPSSTHFVFLALSLNMAQNTTGPCPADHRHPYG